MRKKLIRLTESDLHNIIEDSVRKILKEEIYDDYDEEDYNPWNNGDASYLNGEYDIPYGFHVEINTDYSTVAIDDSNGNEEESYFLQGNEADDLIKKICKYWSENDVTQEEAINAIISVEF